MLYVWDPPEQHAVSATYLCMAAICSRLLFLPMHSVRLLYFIIHLTTCLRLSQAYADDCFLGAQIRK